METRDDLLEILRDSSAGDRAASDQLFRLLYPELRRRAERYLSQERSDHTLQPTALVHEAYLRLADVQSIEWRDRVHFLVVASRTMRRVLVDHARRRRRAKRQGRYPHVPIETALDIAAKDAPDIVEIDQALSRLEEEAPSQAQVVEMRIFGGLTENEIAEVLGITTRTVRRYWAYAQARLYEELTAAGGHRRRRDGS